MHLQLKIMFSYHLGWKDFMYMNNMEQGKRQEMRKIVIGISVCYP